MMFWALLCIFFSVSGLQLERQQVVPVLDSTVALVGLQISKQLAGSSFELESDANIKVDTAGHLDFAVAPANQFFLDESSDLIVTGSYRELVPATSGVFFYIYWIARTANQGIQVEFRKEQATRNPLDVRLDFNPTLGLVRLDLWTCIPVGSSSCAWASPSGGSWNMAENIAYFSYNAQIIPGSETHLITDEAPAWFLSQQATWAVNGIPARTYAKGGIDLKQLPCYAAQECADWDWIGIIPYGSDQPAALFPFSNGYCSHINIQKSNALGTVSLAGAVFGLYNPLGAATALQKGLKIGSCTTNDKGKCSITTDLGTKLLFEDTAPTGFLKMAPIIVNIPTFGMMISYPLRDKEAGSTGLKIQKVSGVTGAPVTGASFELRQTLPNGTIISWHITNTTSTFCTDYPPDRYSQKFILNDNGCVYLDIIETKPPPGFLAIVVLNATFCVSSDPKRQECTGRGVITVRDQPTPLVTLTKVGQEGVSIVGTVLGLSPSGDPNQDYSEVPPEAKCTILAGKSSCSLYAPTLGRYYVVEVLPPLHYDRAPPQGPYDIVVGGRYAITVQDTLTCYGAPTIQRLNCDGSAVDMTGSVYTVTSGSKTIVFRAEEGYHRYCIANGTDVFPLDASCCGNFTITETVPPTGQPPAQPPTKQIRYCGNSHDMPDCGERQVDLTFESPPCYGTFVISKSGPYGVLDGVKFSLSNPSIDYSVTKTTANGGLACWTEVPMGLYTLKEIATIDGYVLDTGTQIVEIPPTDNPHSCDNPTARRDIYNHVESAAFKIIKKREASPGYFGATDYLSGAVFLVKRVGSSWQKTVTIGPSGIECVIADALSTYTIQEITPPDGFSVDPAIRTVTIHDGSTCANTQLEFTFYDRELSTPPSSTTTCPPSTTQPPTTPPPTTTTCPPSTTQPPTTPPPTTTTCPPSTTRPPRFSCGLKISVFGERSYVGGSEPLPGAVLEVLDVNGQPVAGPFVMNSGSVCVNIPQGSYSINEVSPPPSSAWTAETSFPIRGECVTECNCPQTGAEQTILYKAK